MKINWYLLKSGKLQKQTSPADWPEVDISHLGENWFDIEEAEPDEIKKFLTPLNLHPLILDRCVDLADVPGVISYDKAVLLEFPIAFNQESEKQAYMTFVLQFPVLVTIRHGVMPAIDELAQNLIGEKAPVLNHLVQILYLILDEITDTSVEAETEIRDQILNTAKILTKNPGLVQTADLTKLRWQVDKLVALIENQQYCIAGLNASDNDALKEPHRRAYLQDLQSEIEIAQRGIYRLETRVNDLYAYYQMAGSDLVEKRLRTLTIISAITLPLGLIAGLLGMNVGGVPWINFSLGFIFVIMVMVLIAAGELWYFKKRGWFD